MPSIFYCDYIHKAGVVPKLPIAEQLILSLKATRTKRSRRLKIVLPSRDPLGNGWFASAVEIDEAIERLGRDPSDEEDAIADIERRARILSKEIESDSGVIHGAVDEAKQLLAVLKAPLQRFHLDDVPWSMERRGFICLAPYVDENKVLAFIRALSWEGERAWKWTVIGPQAAFEKPPTNATEYLQGFRDAVARSPEDSIAIYLVNLNYHRDLRGGVPDIDDAVFAERDKIVLGDLAARKIPVVVLLDCSGAWDPTQVERFAATHRETCEVASVALTEWYHF